MTINFNDMIKFDIVLQGSIYPVTNEVIESYSTLTFVNKIILSSYNIDKNSVPSYVICVDNEIIGPRGITNRNLQINTSRNGLRHVDSDFAIKMRTDQLIRPNSMNMMYNYWLEKQQTEQKPNPARGKIYVIGLYTRFPYHPRDHVYWGHTEDLINLFNIPFDYDDPGVEPDYTQYTRSETYIAQYYYARFNPKVYEHILNPKKYLVDNAPYLYEAMSIDSELKHKIFAVFPRISMYWPKYGLNEYHYHIGEICSEYWDDEYVRKS